MDTNGRGHRVDELAALPPSQRRDHASELGDLLSSEDPYVQSRAMELVVGLSEEHPDAVVDLLDEVTAHLGDGSLGEDAAQVVGTLSSEYPEAVKQRLPLLVAALDSGGAVTVHVTDALASLGEHDAEVLARRGILETLFDLLEEDDEAVRTTALRALGEVAGTDPEAVGEAASSIADRLDDPAPAVQRRAAFALGELAGTVPEPVFEATGDLCDLLESSDRGGRSGAAYALGEMATAAESIDAETMSAIVEGLRVDTPAVRQHASFLVATVAAENPRAVKPHADEITRGMADTDPRVRRNLASALEALGESFPDAVESARAAVAETLEDPDAVGSVAEFSPACLRALAGDDRAHDDLRTAAREAVVLARRGVAGPAGQGEPAETGGQPGAGGADRNRSPPETDDRVCPNCGEEFGSDATFCSVCGTSLD